MDLEEGGVPGKKHTIDANNFGGAREIITHDVINYGAPNEHSMSVRSEKVVGFDLDRPLSPHGNDGTNGF